MRLREILSRPFGLALIVLLALTSRADSSFAQSAVPPAVPLESFSERLTKEVPVSGRILVGAYALFERPEVLIPDPKIMWAKPLLTSLGSASVCVTTISQDGRFYSEGALSGATLAAQAVPFRITAVRSEEGSRYLESLSQTEVAQLAVFGDCATGGLFTPGATVVLLHRQQESTGNPQGALFMLNSQRLLTRLQLPGEPSLQANCEQIADGLRTAFDTVCRVTGPLPSRMSVIIQRKRYERALPDISLDVVWASQ